MTLTNGSVSAVADVNILTGGSLFSVEADNARLPHGHFQAFTFHNLTASTPAQRRQASFVVPFNCLVESFAVLAGDFTASSSLTVTVAPDTEVAAPFPITLTTTISGTSHQATRLLYDGTKGRAGPAHLATNRAVRVLLRGATVTLTVSTTSATTTNFLEVVLAFRSFWGRP